MTVRQGINILAFLTLTIFAVALVVFVCGLFFVVVVVVVFTDFQHVQLKPVFFYTVANGTLQ